MQIAQTDEQFHEIIYNSTKNQKLVQILNNLREQMYRYRLEYIKDADKRQILMVEHEHILKALSCAISRRRRWLCGNTSTIRRSRFSRI